MLVSGCKKLFNMNLCNKQCASIYITNIEHDDINYIRRPT